MSKTKQTAVSWLLEQISNPQINEYFAEEIEQAKQMEKEQITTAWCEGNDAEPKEVTMDFAEEYYTQTYEN